MRQAQLLVVGAGPYGIAVAAYAKWLGIDVVVVGKPLDLWKTNMPRGMFMRSAPDWHLDARNVATFEAYLSQRGPGVHEARPVALETFLNYAGWFMGYYDMVCHAAHGDAPGAYSGRLHGNARRRPRRPGRPGGARPGIRPLQVVSARARRHLAIRFLPPHLRCRRPGTPSSVARVRLCATTMMRDVSDRRHYLRFGPVPFSSLSVASHCHSCAAASDSAVGNASDGDRDHEIKHAAGVC